MTKTPFRCGIEASLAVIGGKWKSIILWHLEDPRRFQRIEATRDGH